MSIEHNNVLLDENGKPMVDEDGDIIRISPRTGKPVQKKFSPKYKGGKKKKKCPNKSKNGKNSPVIGMNGYDLQPGDNTNTMMVGIELFNLPEIDFDNVEEVNQRINEFFMIYAKYDLKPTVVGLAMSLGISRYKLMAIVNDRPINSQGYYANVNISVATSIKKAHNLMENMWEQYMNSGKINPVAGIFLGKNNFGYADKQEHVVTPNTQRDDDFSAEDIKARYLPPTIEND